MMMVGSAESSAGGVASVIRTIKKMPVWQEYDCYWLGTQIQRNYLWKLWYALSAAIIAPFVMWRYSIVHFHTVPDRICLIIQMPELLCAKLYGKKVIMHIHMGNQLNDHTNNKLFKWCLRRGDLVVLLAKRWEQLFKEKFSDINVPTTVVYNACETANEIPTQKKEKSVIMAAYFNDNKAPDLLLKAWGKLKNKYPDWKVTMMGNGEVERFKKMAHDMGLDDCVRFTGYVTGKEKEDIWNKASIYCMCSYNEGFPMVVLEAWAHNISVVSTPVGGLPDVMEDGKNLLTFGYGDWEVLADNLERLINDDVLRSRLQLEGYKLVKQVFDVSAINEHWIQIYKMLL